MNEAKGVMDRWALEVDSCMLGTRSCRTIRRQRKKPVED